MGTIKEQKVLAPFTSPLHLGVAPLTVLPGEAPDRGLLSPVPRLYSVWSG